MPSLRRCQPIKANLSLLSDEAWRTASKAGKDLLSIYYDNHREAAIFDGKGLVMGGSSNIRKWTAPHITTETSQLS
ncbi:MAG: hypothetical protein U5L09_01580 [Bacteroidales bacterium]|nr:hypothetical protein [Bacteroidales bacterium]